MKLLIALLVVFVATITAQRFGTGDKIELYNGENVNHLKLVKPVYNSVNQTRGIPQLIVETLVVLDKEFGDVFQHDRQKILDYLTVYFWDLNMRFKTLPSVDMSFRVTGVVVIPTTDDQPFIEQARNDYGAADLLDILPLFSNWVNENVAQFPNFDLAIAITKTKLISRGGLAYTHFNCNKKAAAVFSDHGEWHSVTQGAQILGLTFGAPRDSQKEDEGCPESGYIMNGANDELKWFFSECSDKYIKELVTSDQATCMRQIDEPGTLPISSEFSDVTPPTMDEQCKKRAGPTAYVSEGDTSNCWYIPCVLPVNGQRWVIPMHTADNSPCQGGGHCFRGRCRNPDFLFQNAGSGQCLKAPNAFEYRSKIELVDCPGHGTPLDRFAISDSSNGKILGTPWNSVNAMENGDKCIYPEISDKGGLYVDRCSKHNSWHGWDFIDLENQEFLLKHRVTKRCAKQVGNGVQTLKDCDRNDRDFRWKLK